MISKIQQHFPGTRIAGSYSPPFRELTTEENSDAVAKINESHADILWVGLGCPKQEVWMYEHQHQVNVPVMVGVGQAFNIVAGNLNQAPRWMREHGLEWLFRLLLEPRRLWKRYLVYNSKFLFHITRESFFPKK
jgi:N-acetylglucosaminyldiphosphoundecaprenol N-acetyl-beta-D-mannosaminyltransferase